MKISYMLLIGILCVVSAQTAIADDIKLFTTNDTEVVQDIVVKSGAGIIFAGIDMLYSISLWIVPVLIGVGLVLCSLLNNAEKHRALLQGMVIIVVAVIALKLYFAAIGSFTPDLSTINF